MNTTLTRPQTIKSFSSRGQLRTQPHYPEGWTEGLTSEEFLNAAKQMLRTRF